MLGVGGDPFNDELAPRHAEGERRPVSQQRGGAADHARSRRLEGRMALGIHGVLVERDRELDKEFPQLARQRGPLRRSRRRRGGGRGGGRRGGGGGGTRGAVG